MSEHETSYRSCGTQLQKHEVLDNVYENEALSVPMCSNGLEVSERVVRILKTIQGVRGRQLLEIRKLFQMARDRQMTRKLMEHKLHIERETIRQIILEGLGRKQICMSLSPTESRTRSSAVILNRCLQMTVWWTSDTYLVHLTSHQPTFSAP